MTITAAEKSVTTQVYRVFIKATAQAIWDAITQPGWSEQYRYGCPVEYDLRPGGEFRSLANAPMKAHGVPDVIIVGKVLEVDPPRRLVQTWHPVWDPQSAAETHTTLTYEIDEQPGGMCAVSR